MNNFKVRCVTVGNFCSVTAGKVYSVVNGKLIDDDGDKRPCSSSTVFGNVQDMNDWLGDFSGCKFELVEESEMFKKEYIKVGYVLELNNDPDRLVMVLPDKYGNIGLSSARDWFQLSKFSDNLDYSGCYITKIYGRTFNCNSYKLSTEDRELLWKRKPVKEITVSEAEKALTEKFGENVRIVVER